jgi:hypothetical protein
MLFQVKVRVNISKMAEFGSKLQKNELDRSCIRGETYCLNNDPAVGFSLWEAENQQEFDVKFAPWRDYYENAEVNEVITPLEAMTRLYKK